MKYSQWWLKSTAQNEPVSNGQEACCGSDAHSREDAGMQGFREGGLPATTEQCAYFKTSSDQPACYIRGADQFMGRWTTLLQLQ